MSNQEPIKHRSVSIPNQELIKHRSVSIPNQQALCEHARCLRRFFPQKCHFLESKRLHLCDFWQCLGKFLVSFRYVLDMF